MPPRLVMVMTPVPRILLIEHDLDDAFAFEAAVKKTGSADLHLCRHFDEAKSYLQGAGQYSDRNRFPFPRVIVSDLVSGTYSAIQFMTWLHETIDHNLILFVLTRSPSTAQRAQAASLGARVFDKPEAPDDLQILVKQIIRAARPRAVPLKS